MSTQFLAHAHLHNLFQHAWPCLRLTPGAIHDQQLHTLCMYLEDDMFD
jgi:hypothetical protein